MATSQILKRVEAQIKSILSSNKVTSKNYPLKILPESLRELLPPVITNKKSAILVLICDVKFQGPSILFTLRSKNLKHHSNEISFPGGHLEDCDGGSVVAAALRETVEELLPSQNIQNLAAKNSHIDDSKVKTSVDIKKYVKVLGQTEPIPSARNIPVYPIIGSFAKELPEDVSQIFPGNDDEVSRVFAVSLKKLIECECEEPLRRLGRVRNGMGPVYKTEHGKIWGLTGMILQPILHKVLLPVFSRYDTDLRNFVKDGKGEERIPGIITTRSKF